ncbi:MAG: LPP20 family lipoprotein [Bacteroidota bacterium]
MKNLLFLFLSISLISAQGKKPDWAVKRPNTPGYYHGIGIVPKSGTANEYLQKAKDAALNDIAQQIVVSIDASQKSKLTEKLGEFSEEFQSAVQTSTKADLEGIEIVDTWEGEDQYWVYHRLSIAEYKRIQTEKLRKASALALDFYTKAKNAEKGNNIGDALQAYIQALSSVEKFLNETMEVQYGTGKIFLVNEIFSSLQSILNSVELKPKNGKVEAQVGKPLRTPLEVIVTNTATTAVITNFPIRFSFIRGSGDILPMARSDKDGIASTQIAKVIATDKLQLVKAEADPIALLGESASPVIVALVKSFSLPMTRFTLNVISLSIVFETEEALFGNPLKLPRIEPLLKNTLSTQGFSFVEDAAKANILISVKANGRDGGEYSGMYTVYVDANISVTDLNSGEEIYKTSFNNVKGISINSEKAGMKAYDEIGADLQKKVIPKILEQMKK